MKIAVFAGSFDPITRGHEDIVLKAMPLSRKDVCIVAHTCTINTPRHIDRCRDALNASMEDGEILKFSYILGFLGKKLYFCKKYQYELQRDYKQTAEIGWKDSSS